MLLTEYDEEKTRRLFQKEYEEEVAEAKQEIEHAKEEIAKKDEIIRSLKEQLERANQK